MAPHASIRSHLLGLVFAVALPLVALAAWNFHATAQADLQHSRERVFHLAQITAADISSFLDDTKSILNGLAARTAVSALDPERCDPIMKDFLPLAPRYANLVTIAMDGRVVCSAQPLAQGTRANPDRFLKLMRGPEQLTVGKAGPGVVTGRWVVPIGLPLLGSRGGIAGAVVLPVDLMNLPVLPSVERLPVNSVVGLIAADGTVLARSLEAERYVGTNIADSSIAIREKNGTAEIKGIDGNSRILGFTQVPGTDWIAFASVPASEIYAGATRRIATSALIAAALLFGALLLAARWSRRIVDPVTALARAAADIADGNLAARAPIAGTTEIADVATQFNRMLDSRMRVEAELREAERRFREILSSVELISVILDTEGRILFCNEFLLRLTGWQREAIIGQDWFALFVPPEADNVKSMFLELVKGGQPARQHENEILTKSGRRRLVHWNNLVLRSPQGVIVATASIGEDITERNRAEQVVRESEETLRLITETIDEVFWMSDLVTNKTFYISPGYERVWGRTRASLQENPRSFLDSVHPEDLDRVLADLENRKSGQPFDHEYRINRPDGTIRWIWVRGYPVKDGTGKVRCYAGVAQDITERKRVEKVLRESGARLEALTRRLLEVQENERRSVARELHDEVGGVLTAVKLNLQSLRGTQRGDFAEAALSDGLALVDGAIQTVRSLSLDLRPAVLDDLGLIPALKWYCGRQAQRAGVPIELALDAVDLRSTPQLESVCYRIVQEAVTNALRHANARRIQVALRRNNGSLAVEIADNGGGFDIAVAHLHGLAGGSSGLLGMEERANLLGGRLDIVATPGAGTRVKAVFAVPEDGFA